MKRTTNLKLGLAGLGSIGASVARSLINNGGVTANGRKLDLIAVSARDRSKERGVNLAGIDWYDDPVKMVTDADCDIIIELIGEAGGVGFSVIETALKCKRHVVTANKAALSDDGLYLTELAAKNKVTLAYHAAAGAGIPIFQAIRDLRSSNNILQVQCLINGTSNFVLSQMEQMQVSMSDALVEARRIGLAEADPSADIKGTDAAHKISILARHAFGASAKLSDTAIGGIDHIQTDDIIGLGQLGVRIKLLADATFDNNHPRQEVAACGVSKESLFGITMGTMNAALIRGDLVGEVVISGSGAGGDTTSSGVLSDLVAIAFERHEWPELLSQRAAFHGNPSNIVDAMPLSPRAYAFGRTRDICEELAALFKNFDLEIAGASSTGDRNYAITSPIANIAHSTSDRQRYLLELKTALDQYRKANQDGDFVAFPVL